MGIYDSSRNFGYGKQMEYAGKMAIQEYYGGGHYGSTAAHVERWGQFAAWAKEEGIRDATKIDQQFIEKYAEKVAQDVASGNKSVSYGQNLLSSVNVTLSAMRGDKEIAVSPSQFVGERSSVKTEAPRGLDRNNVQSAVQALNEKGLYRAAAVVQLARETGVRLREATLADLNRWKSEADKKGAVNIQDGTKGGRNAPRWIELSEAGKNALSTALSARPEGSKNMIADKEMFISVVRSELNQAREVLKENGLVGYHDLRAAYACERYEQITGYPAPAVAGERQAGKVSDQIAREIISTELGHNRVDVVAAYVGSSS